MGLSFMQFNTYVFLFVFLPVSLLVYNLLVRAVRNEFIGKIWLIAISFFFIGYYDYKYALVFLASTVVNYLFCRRVRTSKTRSRFFMASGIVFNSLLLVFFKYYNCVFKSDVALFFPLGLSFYTFFFVSVLVEAYRSRNAAQNDEDGRFVTFAVNSSFFPKLIQGPICKPDCVSSQLSSVQGKKVDWECMAKGLFLFSIGLFKKVVIADKCAVIANDGFSNVSQLNTLTSLITIIAYTLQIYFDFSGYSDMALGIGKLFNIELPINFNSPYKALSISEFWKRWHISLTRFLTDYIYIPLGGNRKGVLRTYVNILIVFFISGIWHGAGINFIIWGMIHGIAMVIDRRFGSVFKRFPKILRWIVTITIVSFSWVFFRADSISDALIVLKKLASFSPEGIKGLADSLRIASLSYFLPANNFRLILYLVIDIVVPVIIVLFCRNSNEMVSSFSPKLKYSLITVFLLSFSVISFSGTVSFVYAFF